MKKAYGIFVLAFFSAMTALGQEKDVNINIGAKDHAWYATPWVWVVGAAVFILLLVALTRGSGRKSD